jgi:hypothetical protein
VDDKIDQHSSEFDSAFQGSSVESATSADAAKPGEGGSSQQDSIIVRQHTSILYWWPVWVIGLLFGVLSLVFGERVEIGGQPMWFHPSRNLGMIYVTVFAVVFMRTNIVLRGVLSMLIILAVVIAVLVLSLFGWWDHLFSLEQHLSVHMDAGFYFVISGILCLSWVATVFVFDRFTYCEFRPGQLVLHNVVGGGVRTFDTRGMSIYKLQDDLFRHWCLGLGTGDLHLATTGAEGVTLDIRNVAFIDRKLRTIRQLIAMSPDALTDT